MIVKNDLFTLPLPLEIVEVPAATVPQYIAPDEPSRPYLDWKLRITDAGEAFVTRWHQDGLLLAAKVEALELVDDSVDDHLWRHRITVHTYDESDEEAAILCLDDVIGPLRDLDIFPIWDDFVHEAADQCVAFVHGQQGSLFH
jgi:hypothetical protein